MFAGFPSRLKSKKIKDLFDRLASKARMLCTLLKINLYDWDLKCNLKYLMPFLMSLLVAIRQSSTLHVDKKDGEKRILQQFVFKGKLIEWRECVCVCK